MDNYGLEAFQTRENEEQLAARLTALLDTAEDLHARLDIVAQSFSAGGLHDDADRLVRLSAEFGRVISVGRDQVGRAKIGNVLKGILHDSIVNLQQWIAEVREAAGVPEKRSSGVEIISLEGEKQRRRKTRKL